MLSLRTVLRATSLGISAGNVSFVFRSRPRVIGVLSWGAGSPQGRVRRSEAPRSSMSGETREQGGCAWWEEGTVFISKLGGIQLGA